jgi:nucleoside-diphosphate-sugar epimerase
VDALLRRGLQTVVLDNFSTGSEEWLRANRGNPLLRVIPGDLLRTRTLLAPIERVDYVFHEAAIASVPQSVREPIQVHDVNVRGTLELLQTCVEKKAKKVMFASTAAAYGAGFVPPASEDQRCSPSSPYAASKLAVEDYLAAYLNSYGLEYIALRYFNVYGPRQRATGDGSVVGAFARAMLCGEQVTVFGDGTQTRDFVHVRDVVQANLLAMDSDCVGEVFNVASGRSFSVLQLFHMMKEMTGFKAQPVFAARRPGDLPRGEASIAKIRGRLSYRPGVRLEDGLKETIDHYREVFVSQQPGVRG